MQNLINYSRFLREKLLEKHTIVLEKHTIEYLNVAKNAQILIMKFIKDFSENELFNMFLESLRIFSIELKSQTYNAEIKKSLNRREKYILPAVLYFSLN